MGKAKVAGKPAKKTVEKKREKIVEDKTFGLKNKNKSKKVQQFISRVQATKPGGSAEQQQRREMEAKKAKEATKEAEKEMLALLGEAYALSGKKKDGKSKVIKKAAEKLKQEEEEEAAKLEVAAKEADEKDFGMPICSLRDAYGLGSKAIVERLCVELTYKDNLIGKAHDGSACLYIKIEDGTTRNPMIMTLLGETPQSFPFKVGEFLDIRNAIAMVRGSNVFLELPKGTRGLTNPVDGAVQEVLLCSERLVESVKEKMEEEIAIRERGGIPVEERIEEERANLTGTLTPVTKERFFEWKENKRKAKQAEWEKLRKQTKKGAKGLLSGRALFAVDASLFVDDEAAVGNEAYALRADADAPPAPDDLAKEVEEQLYLDGDDDLDDLDDLDEDE